MLLENCTVYCCDAAPELSAVCQITGNSFRVPQLDSAHYISFLLDQCLKYHIKLVIPTIDTELILLSEHKELFANHNITILVSEPEFIKTADNKRLTHIFFKACGIPTAKELENTPASFPVFVKPLRGSRSRDAYVISNKVQLDHITSAKSDIMILEYLDHTQYDEFTCDLYYDKKHQLRCIIPRKRLLVRAGEVNKGVTIKNFLFDFIKEKLDKIPGARGCICIQFFVHKTKEQIFGIEINARFSGGYPLTYAAGGNFPKWIIQEYLLDQEVTDKFENLEANVLMLRYDQEVITHGYKDQ